MHISVMKKEVIDLLNVKAGQLYIDCTFGQGGHTEAILEQGGVVISIDRDSSTLIYENRIKNQFQDNFKFVNDSFSNIFEIWQNNAFPVKPDGILFDLGFSSNQIEDPNRGFSFLYDSSLDMRYDNHENSETALTLINSLKEEDLSEIFIKYGEEFNGKKIAKKICTSRKIKKIESCFEFLKILSDFNQSSKKHYATKIFQALRIYVNKEFQHIEKGIDDAMKILKPFGKIVVITFHSLEDRIIKNKFQNKNILYPTEAEIKENVRSRSAKVRWFINNLNEEELDI
ncbi:16S rRNA (cytosine(1402)-N(4))-methyltransferase RsmH [Alphaproteobacteria bacterium endosymbiont of Tiliacea citrago]|uniref:16S rRNA (cytosine(1402)-N(4))-methyltransferase RsmH n=1 Tax=Alphaproteobacteria bacterium endosymbiont of Tiliacea citrago TaxID=3077944 RepID=UPI00313D5E6B